MQQAAATFQTKVAKSLEGNLRSPEGAARARSKARILHGFAFGLWRPGQDDGRVARERGAGEVRRGAAGENIAKFDDAQVGKITELLDSFRKQDPGAVPFALALVAGRLRTPRELMHIATKAARSRSAADVAATPYAIAVSMVLDQIDDKRVALALALQKNRDHHRARRAGRHRPRPKPRCGSGSANSTLPNGARGWRDIRDAIADLVEAEVNRFPDELGHVLELRNSRGNGLLTGLIGKGRDAISDGAFFCKRLIGQA